MNIALCTDEKYAYPCGVCITSILKNNKDEECNIYILTPGLKENTIARFNLLAKTYHKKIEIIIIDDSLFANLKICPRFPISIYYRFLLPQLLKTEKVLYLDCDIIVTGNLRKLWDTDISNYACGVIEDQNSDDITIQNRLEQYRDYFNSGVLLINLNYWRKNKTSSTLVDFISNNPEKCLYPDQDALNYILGDKVLFLEYRYNYQEQMLLPKEGQFLHKNKWKNLLETKEIPTIIHYTGGIKPWIKNCSHPLKTEFIKYKNISNWNDFKIKPKYNFWEKIRNIYQHCFFILKDK